MNIFGGSCDYTPRWRGDLRGSFNYTRMWWGHVGTIVIKRACGEDTCREIPLIPKCDEIFLGAIFIIRTCGENIWEQFQLYTYVLRGHFAGNSEYMPMWWESLRGRFNHKRMWWRYLVAISIVRACYEDIWKVILIIRACWEDISRTALIIRACGEDKRWDC